jgi:hypothetical protein
VSYYNRRREVSDLVGETLIQILGMSPNSAFDDEITFYTASGKEFRMYHRQDCCESVYLADVVGDPTDLIGFPLLVAKEINGNHPPAHDYTESYTWTFYEFATNKGTVQLRWYGESNGYYSESVDFEEVIKNA